MTLDGHFTDLYLFFKIAIQKHYHDDGFLTFFLTKRRDSHKAGTDFCCKFSETDKSNSTWNCKVDISKGMSLSWKNIIFIERNNHDKHVL